jgi:pimeloyl-ACP methyl ester carboxylesterase
MIPIDRLILYPTRQPMPISGAERLEVPVESLGSFVEVWIHRRPALVPSRRRIRLVHFIGNASRAEVETPLAQNHFPDDVMVESWVMNPPGFGRSPGQPALRSLVPAGLAVFDAASRDQDPVFVSGMSLGSTIALRVAAERPGAAVLVSNAPPLQTLILEMYGWWNLWTLSAPVAAMVPSELNSLKNAPQATGPALFLMAEDDEVVPVRFQRRVFDAYAGPKQVVAMSGARHNDQVPESADSEVRDALTWLIGEATRIQRRKL